VKGLRQRYEEAKAIAPREAAKGSPLSAGPGIIPLPRYFALQDPPAGATAANVMAALNTDGYWLAPLGYDSHPHKGDGAPTVAPGTFAQTYVGDQTDTSPYPDSTIMCISIEAYLRNMSVLIRSIDQQT
jgi:hypothetical protein